MKEIRRLWLQLKFLILQDILRRRFLSCDYCLFNDCEFRGDGYNTNGDCLAEK